MSWIRKDGKDLIESCRERFKPEHLAMLDDAQYRNQQIAVRRLLMRDYGLSAANTADGAIQAARKAGAELNDLNWKVRKARHQAAVASAKTIAIQEELFKAQLDAENNRRKAEMLSNEIRPAERRWKGLMSEAEREFTAYSCQASKHSIISLEGEYEKAFSGTMFANPGLPNLGSTSSEPVAPSIPAPGDVEPAHPAPASSSEISRQDRAADSLPQPLAAIQNPGSEILTTTIEKRPARSEVEEDGAQPQPGRGGGIVGKKRARSVDCVQLEEQPKRCRVNEAAVTYWGEIY